MVPKRHLLLLSHKLHRQITHANSHACSLYVLPHLLLILPTRFDRKIDNSIVSLLRAFQVQLLRDVVGYVCLGCIWERLTYAAGGFGEDAVLGGEEGGFLEGLFGGWWRGLTERSSCGEEAEERT